MDYKVQIDGVELFQHPAGAEATAILDSGKLAEPNQRLVTLGNSSPRILSPCDSTRLSILVNNGKYNITQADRPTLWVPYIYIWHQKYTTN